MCGAGFQGVESSKGDITVKRYYERENTPLGFHKFVHYFSLPAGFLIMLKRLLLDMLPNLNLSPLYWVDIAYTTVALFLFLAAFVGFWKWKAYAWYSFMIYLILNPIYSLCLLILYVRYDSPQVVTMEIQLVTVAIYSILVCVYYRKRRPLFFEAPGGPAESAAASDSGGEPGLAKKNESNS